MSLSVYLPAGPPVKADVLFAPRQVRRCRLVRCSEWRWEHTDGSELPRRKRGGEPLVRNETNKVYADRVPGSMKAILHYRYQAVTRTISVDRFGFGRHHWGRPGVCRWTVPSKIWSMSSPLNPDGSIMPVLDLSVLCIGVRAPWPSEQNSTENLWNG